MYWRRWETPQSLLDQGSEERIASRYHCQPKLSQVGFRGFYHTQCLRKIWDYHARMQNHVENMDQDDTILLGNQN